MRLLFGTAGHTTVDGCLTRRVRGQAMHALPSDPTSKPNALNFDFRSARIVAASVCLAISSASWSAVTLGPHGSHVSVSDPSSMSEVVRSAARIFNDASGGYAGTVVFPGGLAFEWRNPTRLRIDAPALPAVAANAATAPRLLPSRWQRYRTRFLVAIAAIVAQTWLIILLLLERRRRRVAELDVRKRMAELGHVNSAAAMGEMSAAIAHELGQPLAAIRANAEAATLLLAQQPPSLEEARRALDDIVRDDERACEVIQRIAALYRKTSGLIATHIDVNALVAEVVRMNLHEAENRAVEIVMNLGANIPSITGDRIQLQQVVFNLLRNAMDAIPAPSTLRRVTVTTTQDGQHVCIAIGDSGIGIPEHTRTRIFDPFFTTKSQGLGMGLAISRRIVEAHNGRLNVMRSPMGGAQLALELPTEGAV